MNIEDLEKEIEPIESIGFEGLTDSQAAYLKELDVPSDSWESMESLEKMAKMSAITSRFSEFKLPSDFSIKEWIGKLFGSEAKDYYETIEAPYDHVQIEEISKLLENCENLNIEKWNSLELEEKVEILNDLEEKIAQIEHRPPCPIYCNEYMGSLEVVGGNVYGHFGGYNPISKDINLNSELFTSKDPTIFKELINPVVHEGRHAYQDYNIHVCEVHPRHSEVVSWSETMGDGKWQYWGDCSTELGQRLYEQQSIEIDARNFANDVVSKIEDKLFA